MCLTRDDQCPLHILWGLKPIKTTLKCLCMFLWFVGGGVGTADGQSQNAATADHEKVEYFERFIRPIFVDHCYECHASATGDNSGDLRLDLADGLRKGGSRGPALNLEKPHESLLLKAMSHSSDDLKMPPAAKLDQQSIDRVRAWLENGAIDPRVERDKSPSEIVRQEKASQHWAFLPLPIASENREQVQATLRNSDKAIDAFINEQAVAKGIIPNGRASRRELIRRLYNDLLGIAPTWEQFQAMDRQPLEAYETWVDTLLSSPHFGERMARRWMDVARYSDNKGYVFQEDREYANAWMYRDWLIEAFNNDLPFDQFVSYQIAADRMDPGPDSKNLNAMGFLTLGRRFLNNENDIADDRIDVITRGLMGLTVACARCHDHKYDAIGMDDYYSLHAVMISNKEPKDSPGPLRLVDAEQIRPAMILKRGNARSKGNQVEKRFVRFLTPVSRPMDTGSGRVDLAKAIVDQNNPLTPRVYVNRIWGWIMGAPLVDTPSDFGLRCEKPAQQRLLDWLAAEFVADGWSTKRLVKRILMSDAYCRSSAYRPESFLVDPENTLWWRGVRKRMDFESMRDSILVACQRLDASIGGPSVRMIDPPFSNRRTVYAYIDRQNLPGVFRSFDFASPDAHVPNRFTTTVPQQGLFMMNSSMLDHYSVEMAQAICEEYRFRSFDSVEERWAILQEIIHRIYRSILLRDPSASQLEQTIEYLELDRTQPPLPGYVVWENLIKSLLCTNEMCFID